MGPELLKGHAAVGLSNKCRGKTGRPDNGPSRSDTLAGCVVGNGWNVVNTSSEGGVGRVVSIGINGNINSLGIRQVTKSVIGQNNGQNKQNNTFFQISKKHDHSVVGGAGDASNAAVKSGRRTKEDGGGVIIGDDGAKSRESIRIAQHQGLVARRRGSRSELGQRLGAWAVVVAEHIVAKPEEAGESLGDHGQKQSFDWISSRLNNTNKLILVCEANEK